MWKTKMDEKLCVLFFDHSLTSQRKYQKRACVSVKGMLDLRAGNMY